jgi:hypothetical protein
MSTIARATVCAAVEPQAQARDLDTLWREVAALKPKRIDVESPAIFQPVGRRLEDPPCSQVVLHFEVDGSSLRIEAVEPDIRLSFEAALSRAARFGIRP